MSVASPPRRDLERITTGIPSLDAVLEGGIPRYSIVFVAGLPGTGKTILCEQALFANGRLGTCLYMSTLSEPVMKMLRFGQRFSFFNPDILGTDVIFADLGNSLRREGPAGFLAELERQVQQHRPGFVVIDSFKVLREEFDEERTFRKFASEVMLMLSTWEVTTFLVGEYTLDDIREQPEFAIADGIIYLYGNEEAQRQKRYMRIMKMRGTATFSGEHYFNISQDGITVYPRMNPEVVGEYAVPDGRIGSAIEGLDEMTGGGIERATVSIIAGSSGTGKTVLSLSMVVAAARAGLPVLFLTLEESPDQVVRNCRGFGWEMDQYIEDGTIDIVHISPSELDLDAHAVLLIERAERIGARLVVLDSISAFEAAVPDTARYQSYLWAIADYFKRAGVAVILTAEVNSGELGSTHQKVSFVSDNIIALAFHHRGAGRARAINIVKMRGTEHQTTRCELLIASDGVRIGEPVAGD